MEKQKYWFIKKPTGFGWFPVSWEGWVITALYAGALALIINEATETIPPNFGTLLGGGGILTALVLVIVKRNEDPS